MNVGRRQLLNSRAHVDLREMIILRSRVSSVHLKQNHLSARCHNGLPIWFHQAHLGNCHRIAAGFITLNQASDETSIEEHEIPPSVTEGALI